MSVPILYKMHIVLMCLCIILGCADEQNKDSRTVTNKNGTTDTHSMIMLQEPTSGKIVDTLLSIKGKARGYWFFEGDFPMELRNKAGKTVYESYISAQSEWMTEDFVPFQKEIPLPDKLSGIYMLILHKSNPSAMEGKADSLMIPIEVRQ